MAYTWGYIGFGVQGQEDSVSRSITTITGAMNARSWWEPKLKPKPVNPNTHQAPQPSRQLAPVLSA